MSQRHSSQQGFTAVVIAALFIAIAVVASAVVERNTTVQQITRRDRTADQLSRLSSAIIEYAVFNKNGTIDLFPCPARADVAPSDSTFGTATTSCWTTTPTSVELLGGTVLRGMVPVLALSPYGITIEDAFDAWNNRIMYIVNRDLTVNSTNYSGAQARNPTITDVRTGQNVDSPDFILVSYGRDGKGATKRGSTTIGITCPSSSSVLREENCDVDTVFNIAPTNTAANATAANYFDDTLSWYASGGGTAGGAAPTAYKLYCWGAGTSGQIGDGGSTDRSVPTSPTLPSGITQFKSVATGEEHTCAIGSNSLPYCWGANNFGQLGDNTTTSHDTPATVNLPGGVTSFSSIATGYRHSCGIGNNGRAYCWGYNLFGQLGEGSSSTSLIPTAVTLPSGVTSFTSISTGDDHSCGIGNNGRAYCWGRGDSGQLGDGSGSSQSTPVAVSLPSGVTSFTSISAGYSFSCGLGNNSRAYCWGLNLYYNSGNGSGSSQILTPVAVDLGATATSYTAVSAGQGFTGCALGNDGKNYCWGHNDQGQTGRGNTSDPQGGVLAVTFPSGVTSFASVSTGYIMGCGLGNNNRAYCWGSGSLGNGTAYSSVATAVPATLPSGVTSFVSVVTGAGGTSCGLGQ